MCRARQPQAASTVLVVPDVAPDVARSDADLERIEEAVPADAAAGERYAARQMAMLDSER